MVSFYSCLYIKALIVFLLFIQFGSRISTLRTYNSNNNNNALADINESPAPPAPTESPKVPSTSNREMSGKVIEMNLTNKIKQQQQRSQYDTCAGTTRSQYGSSAGIIKTDNTNKWYLTNQSPRYDTAFKHHLYRWIDWFSLKSLKSLLLLNSFLPLKSLLMVLVSRKLSTDSTYNYVLNLLSNSITYTYSIYLFQTSSMISMLLIVSACFFLMPYLCLHMLTLFVLLCNFLIISCDTAKFLTSAKNAIGLMFRKYNMLYLDNREEFGNIEKKNFTSNIAVSMNDINRTVSDRYREKDNFNDAYFKDCFDDEYLVNALCNIYAIYKQ